MMISSTIHQKYGQLLRVSDRLWIIVIDLYRIYDLFSYSMCDEQHMESILSTRLSRLQLILNTNTLSARVVQIVVTRDLAFIFFIF